MTGLAAALALAAGIQGPPREAPLAVALADAGAPLRPAAEARAGEARPGEARAEARRAEAARQYPEAMAAWTRVVARAPRDVEAIAHLARLAAWTGDLDRAVVRYRDALALTPGDRGLRSDLADVLSWMRRWDDAEREYRAVLAQDPNHHEALKGLARLLLLRGDTKGAAPLIARGLAHYPGDADLQRARGRLLAATGDLAGAADAFRRAVALAPADGESARALAEVLYRAGDYPAALEAYRHVTALQPDSAHDHVQLARIQLALGRDAQAADEVAAALRLSPVDPEATDLDRTLRRAASRFPVASFADALEVIAYLFLLPIVLAVPYRMRRALRRRPALRAFAWYVVPGFVTLNVALHLAKVPLGRYVDEALVESISEVVLFLGVGVGFLAAVRAEPRVPELRGQIVLAIGAHPDDIELGTAGFLVKLKDSGAKVHGLTLTRGEVGGDPARRREEARRALGFVGLDGYEILDFPDTRLGEHVPALRAAIEERIRRLGATLVLTHAAVDVHGDHRAVHEATREAARAVPTVLCYEDVSTSQAFEPNFYVDVSGYLEDHLKAISFHRSQGHRTYMAPEIVRGRAAHRGMQIGHTYALAFRTLNIVR